MDYWVYENWTVKKAKIHKGSCPYCKHGQGTDKPTPSSGRNDEWHGPYSTLEAAEVVAERTGQPVSRCQHCNP